MGYYWPFVFMLRRAALALNITFLKFNLVAQVLFAVHASLLMFCWLIVYHPFDAKWKNWLEYMNEGIILLMSYFGFLFSDYVQSPIARYSFGYLYIAIILAGLLVNVLVMVITSISDLVQYLRRWSARRASKKNQSNETISQEKKANNIDNLVSFD